MDWKQVNHRLHQVVVTVGYDGPKHPGDFKFFTGRIVCASEEFTPILRSLVDDKFMSPPVYAEVFIHTETLPYTLKHWS